MLSERLMERRKYFVKPSVLVLAEPPKLGVGGYSYSVEPKEGVLTADPLASTRHIAAKYDNASHALAPNVLLPRNRDGTRLRLTSAVDDAIIATARARISLPRGSCALLQSCSSHATSSCVRVNVRGRRPVKGSHSSAAPRSMESYAFIAATRRGVNC